MGRGLGELSPRACLSFEVEGTRRALLETFEEPVRGDDDASELAHRDQPLVVGNRDGEGEATPFDLGQCGLGAYPVADLHRCKMVQLHGVPDAGLAFGELVTKRGDAGFLAQSDDASSCEDGNFAAPLSLSGVGRLHGEVEIGGQPTFQLHFTRIRLPCALCQRNA